MYLDFVIVSKKFKLLFTYISSSLMASLFVVYWLHCSWCIKILLSRKIDILKLNYNFAVNQTALIKYL
jgi:hypothetical protein